jgi:hypothetical protein
MLSTPYRTNARHDPPAIEGRPPSTAAIACSFVLLMTAARVLIGLAHAELLNRDLFAAWAVLVGIPLFAWRTLAHREREA